MKFCSLTWVILLCAAGFHRGKGLIAPTADDLPSSSPPLQSAEGDRDGLQTRLDNAEVLLRREMRRRRSVETFLSSFLRTDEQEEAQDFLQPRVLSSENGTENSRTKRQSPLNEYQAAYMDKYVTLLEENFSLRVRQLFRRVNFFAHYGRHDNNSLGVIQNKLKFLKVLRNEGRGYKPLRGEFVAPYGGVYIFHFAISRMGAGDVEYILKARFEVVLQSFVDDSSTATGIAVVELLERDRVWMEGEPCTLNESYGMSTFGGVLVREGVEYPASAKARALAMSNFDSCQEMPVLCRSLWRPKRK